MVQWDDIVKDWPSYLDAVVPFTFSLLFLMQLAMPIWSAIIHVLKVAIGAHF